MIPDDPVTEDLAERGVASRLVGGASPVSPTAGRRSPTR